MIINDINLISDGEISVDKELSAYKYFMNKLVFAHETYAKMTQPEIQIKNLTLNTASGCNLACSFCFAASIREDADLLDYTLVNQAIEKLNPQRIWLMGGEPLLNPQLINNLSRLHPELQVHITTNGLLLDNLDDGTMANPNITFQISLEPELFGQRVNKSGLHQMKLLNSGAFKRLFNLAKQTVHFNVVVDPSVSLESFSIVKFIDELDALCCSGNYAVYWRKVHNTPAVTDFSQQFAELESLKATDPSKYERNKNRYIHHSMHDTLAALKNNSRCEESHMCMVNSGLNLTLTNKGLWTCFHDFTDGLNQVCQSLEDYTVEKHQHALQQFINRSYRPKCLNCENKYMCMYNCRNISEECSVNIPYITAGLEALPQNFITEWNEKVSFINAEQRAELDLVPHYMEDSLSQALITGQLPVDEYKKLIEAMPQGVINA